MSDYLGNLLERTFAPALAVRPKIPSIFDPPPATNLINNPVDQDTAVESVAISSLPLENSKGTPARRSNQSDPASNLTQLQPSANPTSRTPREPNDTPRFKSADKFPGTVAAKPDPAPPFTAAQSSPPSSSAAFLSAEALLSAPLDSPADAKPSIAHHPAPRKTLPRPHPEVTAEQDSGLHHSSRLPLTQSQGSLTAGINVRPTTRVPEEHSAQQMLLPQTKERANPQSHARSAPLPTIQVTIGRVEVRATQSATPVRARAKREPEMSLETYLQRRTEGGRR